MSQRVDSLIICVAHRDIDVDVQILMELLIVNVIFGPFMGRGKSIYIKHYG